MTKENFESIICELKSNMKELVDDGVDKIANECGDTIMSLVMNEKNNEIIYCVLGSNRNLIMGLSSLSKATYNALIASGIELELADGILHGAIEIGRKLGEEIDDSTVSI